MTLTDAGMYCPAGGLHLDPWDPVPRTVVTHAHADHARWGCGRYLAADPGKHLLPIYHWDTPAELFAGGGGEVIDVPQV